MTASLPRVALRGLLRRGPETDPPGGGQAWELLAPFDKDGSGLVDPKELAKAAKLLHKHQKERRLLLGVIGVLAATVVGLLVRVATGS